jgi:hypothetical protein
MTTTKAPRKPKQGSVRIKPEPVGPWEFIDDELNMIFENEPMADDEYDGPSFKDQVVRLREVLTALREAGQPAPSEILPFDGHFIQIMWVLKKGGDEVQRVYADIECLNAIEVTYTYPDREPSYKTVTDPLTILPQEEAHELQAE